MNRRFYKALNKEPTMYGLKRTGLIFGAVGSIVAIVKLGVLWFVIGGVPGYMIGDVVSTFIHSGALQKWLYWNTPFTRIFRHSRKLPHSFQRWFL